MNEYKQIVEKFIVDVEAVRSQMQRVIIDMRHALKYGDCERVSTLIKKLETML